MSAKARKINGESLRQPSLFEFTNQPATVEVYLHTIVFRCAGCGFFNIMKEQVIHTRESIAERDWIEIEKDVWLIPKFTCSRQCELKFRKNVKNKAASEPNRNKTVILI